jgi:prevent-host-death family protein
MRDVSVADAKAHLSELLAEVESGSTVRITRRGKAVATLSGIGRPKSPVDLVWLRGVTAAMQYHDVSSAQLVRSLRELARY